MPERYQYQQQLGEFAMLETLEKSEGSLYIVLCTQTKSLSTFHGPENKLFKFFFSFFFYSFTPKYGRAPRQDLASQDRGLPLECGVSRQYNHHNTLRSLHIVRFRPLGHDERFL